MKILITSVGSLVGQNILDVLENPKFKGRDKIHVVGTNSIAGNPQNFRCDKVYLVSNTGTEAFYQEFQKIVEIESPDLVLSGRDEDTLRVTKIVRELGIKCKLPYGSIAALEAALDKLKTYQFCKKYDLPFAETYVVGEHGDIDGLKAFAEKYDFPLIAKPIQGFASKGVFFVRSMAELEFAASLNGYMFQEYIGNGDLLAQYFDSMKNLVPLFAHAPNIHHNSCHVIIHPDGSFKDIFISRNEHDSGVTVGFKRIQNEELYEITKRFAKAVYSEGGYGPLTVQFRQDRVGKWKAQEMNMRTNGNTYPRFLMGQDDIGEILSYLYPNEGFDIVESDVDSSEVIIGKVLTSFLMNCDLIDSLHNNSKLEIK